ncbi:MAG: HEAT repeat domain-containing protein [Bacteroidota bacterium]
MRKITDDALKREGVVTSNIESLISSLGNENAEIRREARDLLIAMGEATVPYLISELSSPKEHTRWEAAKALSDMKHHASAEALVSALGDASGDVRWVAGEGLIAIGDKSLEPLLRELAFQYNSVEFRTSATHVLHALSTLEYYATLRPVLAALEKNIMSYSLPVAAYEAWERLRQHRIGIDAY